MLYNDPIFSQLLQVQYLSVSDEGDRQENTQSSCNASQEKGEAKDTKHLQTEPLL